MAAVLTVAAGAGRGGPEKSAADGAGLANIGPAPAVSLTDQSGRAFTLGSTQGKAVLVGFVYTTCGGVCPATTHAMYCCQQALKDAGLWGKNVEFVSISLDPAKDTPEVLANYAKVFGADLNAWHFLTGPPGDVSKVVADWGMWARVGPSGTLDHPSRVFLIDPNGRQREIYNLEFLTPEAVVQDVKALLAEPRRAKPPG